ncbi:MAG TPA: cytochrome c maturation protein CcmE, partial [bacterium]|nr:cytochrome c maturation protein CcmE [bacterium]
MKAKMVIGVVVIVGALIYLMVSGFRDSSVYYMTVSELSGQKAEVINEGLRVSGYVDPQSIAWNAEKIELDFTLFEGSDSLRVHYKGVIPDQLADAQGVLAEGKLTA